MCFAKAVADYLVYDRVRSPTCLDDIPDYEVRNCLQKVHCYCMGDMYRIDHCVAGCMPLHLPWEKYLPQKPRKYQGRSPRYFLGFQGR